MNAKMSDSPLRERLRAGDPAALGPAEEERRLARLARRIAVLEPRPVERPARRPLVVPLAAALAVAALAWLWTTAGPPRNATAASRAGRSAPPPASTDGAPASAESRQLQFETPGGTRVVWVLDPHLVL